MAFSAKDIANFIPDYDGNQTELHDFVAACDHAIDHIDDDNITHIPFLIKSKLRGEAKQFISSRALTDWRDIKNLLLSHFGDTRDSESLLRQLTTSFQKNSENPRSYVQRVQLILTKLRNCTALDDNLDRNMKRIMDEKHERIGLKTILSGLNDPIGSILRSQRPQTITDATSILAEEENLQYLKSFRNMNIKDNIQKPSQIVPKNFKTDINKGNTKHCSFCQKTGHLISECYKKQNKQFQSSYTGAFQNGNSPQKSGTDYAKQVTNYAPQANNQSVIQQTRPSVIKRSHNLNSKGGEEMVDSLQSQTDQEILIVAENDILYQ